MSAANDPPPPGVPSPCRNLCHIDDDSGLCTGCLRTLDEIAVWSLLDDEMRREVLAAIATRRGEDEGAK